MKKGRMFVATILGMALVLGSAVPAFAVKAEAKPEPIVAESQIEG